MKKLVFLLIVSFLFVSSSLAQDKLTIEPNSHYICSFNVYKLAGDTPGDFSLITVQSILNVSFIGPLLGGIDHEFFSRKLCRNDP